MHTSQCTLWSSAPYKARYPDGSRYFYSAKASADALSKLSFFESFNSSIFLLYGQFSKLFNYIDGSKVYDYNNALHRYLTECARSFYKNGYGYKLCEPVMLGYFYGLNRSGYRHIPFKYSDDTVLHNKGHPIFDKYFVDLWDKKFRDLNRTVPFTLFSILRKYSKNPLDTFSFRNRPAVVSIFRPYRNCWSYRRYPFKTVSHIDFFCVLLSYAMCSSR